MKKISPRSRTVTLILACLLFCLCCGGLHRIYTGKIFTGILQILTGGGFVIWQIIDIIRTSCSAPSMTPRGGISWNGEVMNNG